MSGQWKSTNYPGVRYRENPSRKHNGKPDRYFTIRYKVGGTSYENGLGWASEGMTAGRASLERSKLRENNRTGDGPATLAQKREEKRQEDEARLSDTITFGQCAESFITWGKANKRSWSHDRLRYDKHLAHLIANKPMLEIDAACIERIRAELQEKKLSTATINHVLQIVRAVFNFADRMGLYSGSNPMRKIKLAKPNNRKTRFLSKKEAGNLLKLMRKKSETWHDICLLALLSGMRFGEIAALTWTDIDLEAGVITIREAKAGESRNAYVNERLNAMFERRIEENDGKYSLVFSGRFGEKIEKVSRSFDRVVDEMKLNAEITDRRQRITFHSLRHTFASWLAMMGTPILTIKELLGHRTLQMTMRYAHLMPDAKRQAVEKLDF